ncbi:uncharacterized protein LOC129584140 [Paramacrobiotus metropolitanus]|uniref:uncharacterized protein LOC129584140 n=1 Tax=Paramacrobiotus metropolitanus TaxID=2943436 RepID=UPI002445B0FB|nr:uncharacterized protein LOC129584140 [Paramacrobiotus metropolitanus]
MMQKLDALMQSKILEKFNSELEAKMKEFNSGNANQNQQNTPDSTSAAGPSMTFFVGNNRSLAGQPVVDPVNQPLKTTFQATPASAPMDDLNAVSSSPLPAAVGNVTRGRAQIDDTFHALPKSVSPRSIWNEYRLPEQNGANRNGYWNRMGRAEPSPTPMAGNAWLPNNMRNARRYSAFDKGRYIAAKYGFYFPENLAATGKSSGSAEPRSIQLSNKSSDPAGLETVQGHSSSDSIRAGRSKTRFTYI